jgi:copper chaperone CopZ
MNQTYSISGMHCGSCIAKVTAALRPFADDVAVTLTPPQAILTNAKGKLADLQAALSKVGAYGIQAAAETVAETQGSNSVITSARGPVGGPVRAPVVDASEASKAASWFATYQPLLLIVGYIAVASLAGFGSSGWQGWMTNFMAGFFLVFSAFKFLNLSGFADAYATYDLLAKRWHGYGFVYPFLELALGLAYLFRVAPTLTNVATVLLMGFSSLGVLAALTNKRRIACACLGTVLKLPMSTVTLVEDLGMASMALAMLGGLSGHN